MQFSSSSSLLGSISLVISPIFPHSSIRSLEWSSDYSDGSFSIHRLNIGISMRVSLIHIIPLSSPPPPPTFFVLSSWAIQTLSQTQMWPVQDRLPNLYVQFSSVTQSCPTLCNPMNRSTTGLPVHHKLPEFTKTHIHWVSDAIQSSHPLSSTSPPAPNPSQHPSLIQWVNSLHEVAKALEFQLQHHSFQRTSRTDLF